MADEEEDNQKPETRKRPRGVSLDHSLLNTGRPKRQRRPARSVPEEEYVPWNVHEKEKLLEALYRHSHLAYESISHVVKTKSPKQVEMFIEKMLNSSWLNYDKRIVELNPEKGAAPLELWLSLVQELVISDKKTDHSKHYSKILSVIGQNEPMPEDSGFENLNWKHLYQFVSDLLADKAMLQPLSNMESLVVLDMMHSMGDTLHTSDTSQQRRLLDLKYQLFKWQIQHVHDPEYTAAFKAINSDFSGIEYTIKKPGTAAALAGKNYALNTKLPPSSSASTSARVPTSSSSSQSQPSTWYKSGSNQQSYSPPGQSSQKTLVTPHPPSKFSDNDDTVMPSTSTPASISKDVTESSTSASSSSNPITTPPQSSTKGDCITQTSQSSTLNNGDVGENNGKGDDDEDDSDDDEVDVYADPLPKLFSLNPLTIPPSSLYLWPKIVPVENKNNKQNNNNNNADVN